MSKTMSGINKLSKTILALAGVGGGLYAFKRIIIDNVREQSRFIDSTAKMADRLNITTEALVGLQHGAKISGVETETLNKSLEIFSRRLGEVDMGVGQATYALDKLGLNYKDIIGLEADEAFSRVADQINNLSTQAEKAAAANYLFGRSGQSLLNLFETGSAGIEDFRKEAEKLGLTFDRIDAAKVESANDALTRTRAVFTGLFRSATIELAPYIEAAADSFVDFATQGEGVGANVTNAFESMSKSAIHFASTLDSIPAKYNEIMAKVYKLNAFIEKTPAGWGSYVGRKIVGAESWTVKYEEAERKSEESKKWAEDNLNAVEKFYADLRAKADAAQPPGTDGAAALDSPIVEEAKVWSDRMNALSKQVDEEIRLYGRLDEPRQHAKMMIEFEAEAMKTFGDSTAEARAAIEQFDTKLDELETAQKWSQMTDTMSDSFSDFASNAIFNAENIGQAFDSMIERIIQKSIQLAFIDPAAQGLSGFLSKGISGMFSGSSGSGIGADVPADAVTGVHVFHTGAMGYEKTRMELAPLSALANAPKLHLGTNEKYAKIDKREGIFTPEQMKNLAPANSQNQQGGGNTNIYIQAWDSGDVARWFKNNGPMVAAANRAAQRKNYSRRG